MTPGGSRTKRTGKRALVSADTIHKLHERVIPDIRPIDHADRLKAKPIHYPEIDLYAVDPRGVDFEKTTHDVGFTVFKKQKPTGQKVATNDIAVFSNGAGLAQLTTDELVEAGATVSSMMDLKMHFSKEKIYQGLLMSYKTNPNVKALAINVFSGSLKCDDLLGAITKFNRTTKKSIPLIVRMDGPNKERVDRVADRLQRMHSNIKLVSSSEELLQETLDAVYGVGSKKPKFTSDTEIRDRVLLAREIRSQRGVTVDPEGWLKPEHTLGVLIPDNPRILVQGTGRTAKFQVDKMIRSGRTRVEAIVNPSSRSKVSEIEGRIVYKTVDEALDQVGKVDATVIYAPADKAKGAAIEAIEAKIPSVMVVAENMPDEDALDIRRLAEEAEVNLIGPNSPGVMLLSGTKTKPKRMQLGNVPSTTFDPGNVSIVARSGTALFDVAKEIQDQGVGGTRAGICIGGDAIRGVNMIDSLLMLEQDPETKVIVLLGEPGGMQEQVAPELIKDGIITKPVIAMVGGKYMPVRHEYGHAGAVMRVKSDDPADKKQKMEEAGVIVVDRPSEVVEAIKQIDKNGWDLEGAWKEKHWKETKLPGKLREGYDILYDLVGPYQVQASLKKERKATTDFVSEMDRLGTDKFKDLLETTIDPKAFKKAISQNAIYSADLIRSIREIGIDRVKTLIGEGITPKTFNAMLSKNVWSAGDILNEVNEIGIHNTARCLQETMSPGLMSEMLEAKPWNTTHAVRTINNMRWRNFVRSHNEFSEVWGKDRFEKGFRNNPWIAVKLVRGFSRGNIPDEFRIVFKDQKVAARVDEFLDRDMQGLLDVGKNAFLQSQLNKTAFSEEYKKLIMQTSPDPVTVERESEKIGTGKYEELVSKVFGEEAWEKVSKRRPRSAAQALKIARESGVDDLIESATEIKRHIKTKSFTKGVGRNPWTMTTFLVEAGEMGAENFRKVEDEVLTREVFNYSVEEHQWGTSQAFRKINVMGVNEFLRVYNGLEKAFTPEFTGQFFREAFRKNPRDAIEILQHVGDFGIPEFKKLVVGTGAFGPKGYGFLEMAAARPRNTAHFLKEVKVMGVDKFTEVVDKVVGKDLFTKIATSSPSNATRIARSVTFAGVDNFLEEAAILAKKKSQPVHQLIDPDDNLALVHDLMFDAVDKRKAAYGGEEDKVIRFRTLLLPAISHKMDLADLDRALSGSQAFFPELEGLRNIKPPRGHKFDAYTHTLETVFKLDELQKKLETQSLFPDEGRQSSYDTQWVLNEKVDGMKKMDLLKVVGALHDIGKLTSTGDDHAVLGATHAKRILESKFHMTPDQIEFVTTIIRHHKPPKLMKRDTSGRVTEKWDEFKGRGGLVELYDKMHAGGKNPYMVETILLYHADILAHKGDDTSPEQVKRRIEVSQFLLEEDRKRKYPKA